MLLTGAVALAFLAPAQPASAGGVHFDPDSPAGKEYALPLDQARDEAAGVGKSDGPAGEKAPLFGEGVTKGGGSAEPGPSGGGPQGGSPATGTGTEERAEQRAEIAAATAISSSDGGYALSSAILWVAALLALGAIVALVVRATRPHGGKP